MDMDLPSFIRSLAPGDVLVAIDKASELFGEKPGTVKSWLYGERTPRPRTAHKIVARAEGRLSFEDCYRARDEANQ